jgi:uncharacterized protein
LRSERLVVVLVSEALAALLCVAGGLIGGLVGVGGGVLFVPALTLFLDFSQVEAESTSLLMIVIVALVGSAQQSRYGNVNLRDAALVGVLSPLGVGVGVVVANEVPERLLELGFAALALFMAIQLVRRALAPEPERGSAPSAPR